VSSEALHIRPSNPYVHLVTGSHAKPVPNQIWDLPRQNIDFHPVKDTFPIPSVRDLRGCESSSAVNLILTQSDQLALDYRDSSCPLNLADKNSPDESGLIQKRISSREKSLPVLAHCLPPNFHDSSERTLEKQRSPFELSPPLVDYDRLLAVKSCHETQHSYPSCPSPPPDTSWAAGVITGSRPCCPPLFFIDITAQLQTVTGLSPSPAAESTVPDSWPKRPFPLSDSFPEQVDLRPVRGKSWRSGSGSPQNRSISPRSRSASPFSRSDSPRSRSASPRSRSASSRSRSGSPRSCSSSPRSYQRSPRHRSRSPAPRPRWSRGEDSPASNRSDSDSEESDSDYIRWVASLGILTFCSRVFIHIICTLYRLAL